MAAEYYTEPALLDIENLNVYFHTETGTVHAVRNVSFNLRRERLGIVGESGSGKTTIGRALLRLIQPPGEIRAKRLLFEGHELLKLSKKRMCDVRGRRISMVMQDPKFSLNPVIKVGDQIAESYLIHTKASKREARERVIEMLAAVRIRNPKRVAKLYPHELSGGMGQRVMIAMMLVLEPTILIADEPTSALDVTVQMQVLAILDKIVAERGMGLIFISHDLTLVSSFCDRVLIMYAGKMVESCRADELSAAHHPYTRGLVSCIPRIDQSVAELSTLNRDPAWKE
jgi:peptide/nickel transport system ATP-binding protein